MSQGRCHKCGRNFEFSAQFPVGRRDACAQCTSDLHVCLNCRHYDPAVYRECREPQAEYVKEKDRANFCDLFSPLEQNSPGSAGGANSGRDDLLKKAEALFKK